MIREVLNMDAILHKIGSLGIIPVVKIDNAGDAVPLGKALIDGGLPAAEITFRTEAAEAAIRSITKEYPDLLVGAGTILDIEQTKRAVDAGAKFIVSPGFSRPLVEYCLKERIPVTPGCSNPSDMTEAVLCGLEVVKFFPSEACGGINALKAMSAPFGSLKFMPTGGIDPKNLMSYLSFDKVLACGGSWMVREQLVNEGRFDEITRLTAEAVRLMLGFELAHIGINAKNADESLLLAEKLSYMFGFPLKQGNSSNFSGTSFEIMKRPGRGQHGHIAMRTNSLVRAAAYLERNGAELDISSINGTLEQASAVYLRNEIGGFALHLLQKK